MERQLGKLRPMEQRLVTRIAMQRYTQSETAALLGLGLRTVVRGYGQALDSLTELLLAAGMLEPFSGCQGREG
jgi:DNA-directed RNA polymerase specialized sigma24 family protein